MTRKILVTTSTFGMVDPAPIETMRNAGYEVVLNPFERRLTREESMDLLSDAAVVGLVAGVETLDREILGRSHLRVVSRVGSGISNVDLEAASELGIAVRSTPDGPSTAVAELTIGALLSLLRSIPELNRDVHSGAWVKRTGGQIEGRTVLVVGFGRIGARVAGLLDTFGAQVIVADPYLEDPAVCPFPLVTVKEGLRGADIISIHNSGTDRILEVDDLGLLREGVIILIASRGSAVSEQALLEGLDRGIIGGAWADVFDEEPYMGPLQGKERVLLTPHVGSYTSECRIRMEAEAVENLLTALGTGTE